MKIFRKFSHPPLSFAFLQKFKVGQILDKKAKIVNSVMCKSHAMNKTEVRILQGMSHMQFRESKG